MGKGCMANVSPIERSDGTAVLDGNELLVKGALEAGVSLITGYPGSPVANVFDVVESHRALFKALGTYGTIANNEAQSVAMLHGLMSVPGAKGMAVFKSVGTYVALDAMAITHYAKGEPGTAAVVVSGDDPGLSSTQVGADSRATFEAAKIPVLEPSTPQEIKDWVGLALRLSEEAKVLVGFIITTNQADGGGTVQLAPNQRPAVGVDHRVLVDPKRIALGERVSVPPNSSALEQDLLEVRLPKVVALAREWGVNRVESGRSAHIGFVTSGNAYNYLVHALDEMGLAGKFAILKLGMTYPLDRDTVLNFAKHIQGLVVVEEKRPFLENQLRTLLSQAYQDGGISRFVPVFGKNLPQDLPGFPEAGGLDPSLVIGRLGPLLLTLPLEEGERARIEAELDLLKQVASEAMPLRLPTYCPGCPHRGTSSAILEVRRRLRDSAYMRRVHDQGPVEILAHGGIGCYSLNFLPPFRDMHNMAAMGLGGSAGAGAAPFTTNKHYVLCGDSTFFHSEITSLSNALKERQDILYIILDNKNTAMTGHQITPAAGHNLMGDPVKAQDIETVVRGLAGADKAHIWKVNPADRDSYLALLERAFLLSGVRVVIADRECAITYHRKKRAIQRREVREKGYLAVESHIDIVPEVCEDCRACTAQTGCPGLTLVETELGRKVAIDLTTCVDDRYCTQIKACPSFERVVIHRAPPEIGGIRQTPGEWPRWHGNVPPIERILQHVGPLPDPRPAPMRGGTFQIFVPGVGGMGIGLVAKILTEAGQREGWQVQFYHQKGLAQRGGAVISHVLFAQSPRILANRVPDGKADLVLGLDALETARGLKHASPERSLLVVNESKSQTVPMLLGEDEFPDGLAQRFQDAGREYLGHNLSELSETLFGSKLFANLMLLGVACQAGWLPVSLAHMEAAIREAGRGDQDLNLAAFAVGRKLALQAGRERGLSLTEPTLGEWVTEKARLLRDRLGQRVAERFEQLIREVLGETRGLDEADHRALLLRVYELIQYGGLGLAEQYLNRVEAVYLCDVAAQGYRATKAVIGAFFKALAIKDEVYVAYLLTRPEKLARTRERYRLGPRDRVTIRHYNRPHFDVGPWRLEWDMQTRDWMLRIMARMSFLRKWLPQWHRREKAFCGWYEVEVIGGFLAGRFSDYEDAVWALSCPLEVKGYREVRYPHEDRVMARVRELLGRSGGVHGALPPGEHGVEQPGHVGL